MSDPNQRLAIQAHITLALGAGFGNLVIWGRCQYPTILNLADLHHSPAFRSLPKIHHVLKNLTSLTLHEQANGNRYAAASLLRSVPCSSIADLTSAFNQNLWPMRSQASTRLTNWRYWNMVIAWALSWNSVHLLLPMSIDTLKALTYDLISFGCSCSVVRACWCAIQSRHRSFDYKPPILGSGEFSAWENCIKSALGSPARIRLPVPKSIVHALLAWRPLTPGQHCDRLLTALATIICCRPSEVAQLQSCDFWPDFHTSYGIPGYIGTAAINIKKKKNDTGRRGQLAAIGISKNRELDLVIQIKHWLCLMHLNPAPSCTKRLYPGDYCPVCPPLFPVLQNGPQNIAVATFQHRSSQQISSGVKRVCAHFGANPAYFSGVSTRKGGLTIAIQAGVPEVILFLQSGHGQTRAARRYITFTEPSRLFETFQAFDL